MANRMLIRHNWPWRRTVSSSFSTTSSRSANLIGGRRARRSLKLADPLDRPYGGLANQRFRIVQSPLQGGQGGLVALIAQGNGRVPQQAPALAAHQCRAAKTPPKIFCRKA